MRSIIAITLILSVVSVASTLNEELWDATDVKAHNSGLLRESHWAGWSHDGSSWVARFPSGTFMNNSHYGTAWETNTYNIQGPGYNGTIYYPDPNLAPNPASTWDANHEYDPYIAKSFAGFDVLNSSLDLTKPIYLRMAQGGYSSDAVQTGTVHRMTTDPVDPVDQGANWNYSDSKEDANTGAPGAGAVLWTTPGGDYTGSVPYTTVGAGVRREPGDRPELSPQEMLNAGCLEYIDVTALVLAAQTAGDLENLTLIMDATEDRDYMGDTDVSYDWFSHRNTWGDTLAPVFAPYLTNVPEPATMGLLAIGGLALLRRRR